MRLQNDMHRCLWQGILKRWTPRPISWFRYCREGLRILTLPLQDNNELSIKRVVQELDGWIDKSEKSKKNLFDELKIETIGWDDVIKLIGRRMEVS